MSIHRVARASGSRRSHLIARLFRARFALLAAPLSLACAGHATRIGLPESAPEAVGLSAPALARITPALQAYVDAGKLPGVVAIVARHGQIGYAEAVGFMDVEHRVPMNMDAVFRIYSMTKPVVAAGVLRLVDQGRLALDDPVAKYIPAFAAVKVFAGGSADDPVLRDPDGPMTVRHLLTHTAGLGYGLGDTPVDTLYQRANLFDAARTLEQFADSSARLPLFFSPGSRWQYSAAIDVAGRVIEVASGQPLDRFLDREIFAPLGMRSTSFRLRPDLEGRVPVLYSRGDDGLLREATGPLGEMYLPGARFFWGGGGLLSTPADYLRFAQMLLNRGELDGRRVLSRESVAQMLGNQLSAGLAPIAAAQMMDKGYGYGLGGSVLIDSALAELPGSAGIYRWSGYVGTYFWIDPAEDLVAMVWTQFTPGRTYPLEQEFQRLVYAAMARAQCGKGLVTPGSLRSRSWRCGWRRLRGAPGGRTVAGGHRRTR